MLHSEASLPSHLIAIFFLTSTAHTVILYVILSMRTKMEVVTFAQPQYLF